jgi:ASC-1-like (ASCH) protein
MIYDFNVAEPYKSFLLNWKKIVEWRLNKWKFKKFLVWDVLKLDTWEKFKILRKTEYKTFFEMMEAEWIEKVLPDFTDIQDWVEKVYYKFYSPEQERKFGVVAIEVELIKDD